jgi:hypothetical protein
MSKKIILLLVIALAVLAAVYGWNEFNRGAADVSEMVVKEQVPASILMESFLLDEAAATARFVGASEQLILVEGEVRTIEPSGPGLKNVVLATDDEMAGIVCEFSEADVPKDWKAGSAVGVKGICTGMLLDVILIRCVPAE